MTTNINLDTTTQDTAEISTNISHPSLFDLMVTCADGLEAPLQTELTSFGIASDHISTGRLAVSVNIEQLYQICLWSRVASRVLLPIKKKNINTEYDIPDQLYSLGQSVDWTEQFSVYQSFAIRTSVDKRVAVNQQFAMLRIKDAIVDNFNEKLDDRPNIDSSNPDISIYVTISGKKDTSDSKNKATAEIFIDLSGTSLHRRGYRTAMTDAPLKENLAAALLYASGWHLNSLPTSTKGGHLEGIEGGYDSLIDPMCGSGTFLIEALLMYAKYPVGIDKVESQFGFYGWKHHDTELWDQIVSTAQDNYHDRLDKLISGEIVLPSFYGYDSDGYAINATRKNLVSAGLGELVPQINLGQRPLNELKSALSKPVKNGELTRPLIITNPPYGERIGGEENVDVIRPLYQGLGLQVQDIFWDTSNNSNNATLGVIAIAVEQADILPLADPKTLRCHNGAITVYFRHGQVIPPVASLIESYQKQDIQLEEAQEFVNRLQKNVAKLKKMAKRDGVTNLRLYNADLPNFKVAVDLYDNNLHVQEYAPPKTIPLETSKKRFNLALQGAREVLNMNREQVFIKTRARQSGNDQYSKQAGSDKKKGKMHIVKEDGAYLYVNFTDYLDTGLFIDHRNMRKIIKKSSRDKRVLNLFAYTCTASVQAALAGAKHVTSVDLSANYLDWGMQNFALNGLDLSDDTYEFVASDIFSWIKENTEQYDVIFVDPPTFSNSKKFAGTFDVQRDHPAIINRAMNRLASGGVLYFSNNFTKFVMDEQLQERYDIKDITQKTIGFDFNVKKPIHHSFEIRNK